jgi:hypothetical protein
MVGPEEDRHKPVGKQEEKTKTDEEQHAGGNAKIGKEESETDNQQDDVE